MTKKITGKYTSYTYSDLLNNTPMVAVERLESDDAIVLTEQEARAIVKFFEVCRKVKEKNGLV